MRINNKRKKLLVFMLTIVLFMTIGFCTLSSSLNINGTSGITGNTWNIKFQNIVLDYNNTVTGTQSITGDTSLTFSVELTKPGDVYTFTVDVVNTGTIDAMFYSLSKTTLTTEQEKYLEYTVTYIDGVAINQKDKLVKTNGSETIKVTVKFSENYTTDTTLPTSALNLSLTLNYVQADSTAQDITHTDLQTFIIKAKAGNATSSDVGKTFLVDFPTLYSPYTLRVSNVSTPSECSNDGFSQTACGVVLEFADIITVRYMNIRPTNAGGWASSSMRTFVNENVYNALPINLRNAIIETSVVSGHGSTSGETNFTSTDKLYLLSTHEVYTDVDGDTSSGIDYYDTSYYNTRQLDYYSGQNVTSSSYSGAIKKIGSNASAWWLRSAFLNNNNSSLYVKDSGSWNTWPVKNIYGVSPAFRIA